MLAARFIRRYSSSNRTSNEIRRSFVNFFESEGHVLVPSSNVVRPRMDETNPFETPELNQLRGVLTGKAKAKRWSPSVVNVQKYLHHNSMNDVGKDLNGLSFYEMMGNWAFNNAYGKEKACTLAWTFLTEVMNIPKDDLSVTFFGGNSEVPEDIETGEIWKKIGVPDSSIRPVSDDSHFYGLEEAGNSPAAVRTKIHHKNFENACLWNIGFTNYTRRRNGKVVAMDTLHVDTGMRLEDLACVVQGVSSVFETDLLLPLIQELEKFSGKKYTGSCDAELDNSFRAVADHTRALCVAIADLPPTASEHARFIVGKQVYMAAYHAVKVLEAPRNSIVKLVPVVIESLGSAYPLLGERQKKIEQTIRPQENKFWSAYGMQEERSKYNDGIWTGPEWFSRVIEKKDFEQSWTGKASSAFRRIIGF
ncbi:hypothetical protein PMAYCL1PPCAC_08528 [Pristionchus mayeri]|uniref:alanine--tRNA ligase n=1 Tax=Pristionchus mayeri TaxID=1317129 RepID=A0AAN4ZBX9_9BILA|nr:hypothetical protein PMAYCL1PPCAC_08528 [Pristionchus mayeri]